MGIRGKKHHWDEETAKKVMTYAGIGVPHHDIAHLVDIATKTLLKVYRKDLDLGKARANATVAKCMYEEATQTRNFSAMRYWLACQAGWRETSVVQSQALDKNGNPVDPSPPTFCIFPNGGPGHTKGSGPAAEEEDPDADIEVSGAPTG